ncbi:hypothetical protein [Spirosoma lituiforme]
MPFPKGESGNPKGLFSAENQPAKKGRTIGKRNRSTIVKELLGQVVNMANYSKKNASLLEKMGFATNDEAEALLTAVQIIKALSGDTSAYKAIMDSGYGAPSRSIEHSGTIITNELDNLTVSELRKLRKELNSKGK